MIMSKAPPFVLIEKNGAVVTGNKVCVTNTKVCIDIITACGSTFAQ